MLSVSFADYLNLAEIVVSLTLILVILLQARGSGFGGALGGSSTFFRTRRGSEKTLFQLTIVLVVVFILISAWSVTST
jgi:preprotein translocase subunit SecG